METAIRKATRLEYLPPKEKHLTTLKRLTFDNPALTDSMILLIEKRLKEHSWIITFKVLVILHYLMREGNCVSVMDRILKRPNVMNTSQIKNKNSSPANTQNIYIYRTYLDEKVSVYKQLGKDFIFEARNRKGGTRHVQVTDNFLKETIALQSLMDSALKCNFYLDERDLQITFFAYKMVVEDILVLFAVMNESVVNILEHYFEMNKRHAQLSLDIYKTFAKQTELTVEYLNIAKKVENELQMKIPSIKYAPLSLATALEEYLIENNKSNTVTQNTETQPKQTLQVQTQTQPQQQTFQQSTSPSSAQTFQTQQAQQQQQVQQQQQQPFQLQQQQLQTFQQQPFQLQQQQPFQLPFQSFESTYNAPPSFNNQLNMNIEVAPVNRQITNTIDQSFSSTISSSNPFLNVVNQQNTGTPSNFNSSFDSQNFMASRSVNRFSTLPISTARSNNPFRPLSVNYGNPVKHNTLPTQTLHSIRSNNPFAPITPPLTPNAPLSTNNFSLQQSLVNNNTAFNQSLF